MREVVYLGSVTRYLVELDRGETLVVLRQNLDMSAEEALAERGRRVRLAWRPQDASVLGRRAQEQQEGDETHEVRTCDCGLAAAALAGAGHRASRRCGGGGSSSSSSSNSSLPTTIGKGEGQLNLIAWEGYTQPEWVKPFEQQTGCQVHAKYAGSSDEMVTLMRQGGGSQYDMVSASGDASLRLIRGGDVQPVNVNLIPDWKNFIPQLQSPPHNTVDGKHYGISLQWGPNMLLYNTQKVTPAPDELGGDLRPEVQGPGHGAGQPDPDRGRRALPVEDAAGPRHHRPVRAHRCRSSTRRWRCSRSSGR